MKYTLAESEESTYVIFHDFVCAIALFADYVSGIAANDRADWSADGRAQGTEKSQKTPGYWLWEEPWKEDCS